MAWIGVASDGRVATAATDGTGWQTLADLLVDPHPSLSSSAVAWLPGAQRVLIDRWIIHGGVLYRSARTPLSFTKISGDLPMRGFAEGAGVLLGAGGSRLSQANRNYLARSFDAGAAWEAIADGSDLPYAGVVRSGSHFVTAYRPINSGGFTVRRSPDSFQWFDIAPNIDLDPSVIAADGNGTILLGGGEYLDAWRLARSTDHGLTWAAIQPFVHGTDAPISAIAWTGTSWVLAAGTRIQTSPAGQTWTDRGEALSGGTIYALASDGAGRVLAAGEFGRAALSTDHGVTWGALLSTPFQGRTVQAAAFLPDAAFAAKICGSVDPPGVYTVVLLHQPAGQPSVVAATVQTDAQGAYEFGGLDPARLRQYAVIPLASTDEENVEIRGFDNATPRGA